MNTQPLVDGPRVTESGSVVGRFEPSWVSSVARRRWLPILIVGAICAAIGGIHALIAPRVYQGETLIAVTDKSSARNLLSGSLGGLASMAGLNLPNDSAREEAIAYLSSDELARDFIAQTHAADQICLFHSGILASIRAETCRMADINDVVRMFDSSTRFVVEDRRTGLLSLDIDWSDPDIAAQWSNAYVRLANTELRERAISDAEARLGYLEAELAKTHESEVRDAVAHLIESTLSTEVAARAEKDYAFRVVDPAWPSSRKRYVRPHASVEILAGFLMGGTIAFIFLLLREAKPNTLESPSSRQ